MGLFAKALGQLVVSSVILGALKHKGAIRCGPSTRGAKRSPRRLPALHVSERSHAHAPPSFAPQTHSIHPSVFENESARAAFTQAVSLWAESIAEIETSPRARALTRPAPTPAKTKTHNQKQVQAGETATVMTERFFDSLMGEINSNSSSGKKK